MDWKILFVFIAFIVYWIYNVGVLIILGAPFSLSKTFYLLQERKKWQRILFPIMMFIMAGFLMPAWLDISANSNLQFMSFLAAIGLMFTGCAPSFNNSDLENKVHTISAIFSAIFSLLWIIFVANLWYFIVIWTIMICTIAIWTRTIKTSYIYWLETIAFMSTFSSIITYYCNL